MKFILSIYPDRTVELSPEQRAGIPEAVSTWIEEMDGRGVRLEGRVLEPASEAATVRVRDGNVVRENGPATDSDAQVSGFNLLDCAASTRR